MPAALFFPEFAPLHVPPHEDRVTASFLSLLQALVFPMKIPVKFKNTKVIFPHINFFSPLLGYHCFFSRVHDIVHLFLLSNLSKH